MSKIYRLIDTDAGETLYFSTEEERQDYCTKIVNAAINAGVPVRYLPVFGTDYDYCNFILAENDINPVFDEIAWDAYFKDQG